MKSLKVAMILMIFGASACMYASTPTATAMADGVTTIYNNSNLSIGVAYNLGSGKTYWGTPIAPKSSGTLSFKAGDVITQVTIFYNVTSSSWGTSDDGQIRFFPSVINGTTLIVYGNSAVAPGTIDTTVAATPVPARYAAWWTGTMQAANTPGNLLTMHVANTTGTNDFGLTVANTAF